MDHDVLYALLSIAFFADQEIDEMEKNVIYENFGELVQNVTEDSFNIDFGIATKKFLELKNEESRQQQYENSLLAIKDSEAEPDQFRKLLTAFIDIANADEFIHENEVMLIQHAIDIWELDGGINDPKSDERLKITS